MPRAIPNGSTDQTQYFVMRDSTNHAPKSDVTITDIDIYYQEQGAAQSAKADLTALAAADSAHADNKGYNCGNSVYRIDWPDAAFDGGVGKTVILIVVCSGCDTIYREIQLSPQVDVQSISGDATAADNCELMFDGTGYAGGTTKLAVEVNTKTGFSLANGSIAAATFAAGAVDAAALAADAGTEIGAAVKTAVEAAGSHLALIKAKTDLGLLNTTWTDAKAAYLDEAISAAKTLTAAYDAAKTAAQAGDEMDLVNAPNATALTALAVAILDCLLSEGDADAPNARTVRSALRALRNKVAIAAGTLTVYKENDSDAAWTAAATTDPAAEPITVIDPA